MKKQFFRVKQLADQTFLRAEKSEILNHEELQIADQKAEFLRGAVTSITKKIAPCGPTNDIDKLIKKTYEYQLGTCFIEESKQSGECQLFHQVLKEAGLIEHQLAREYAEHEMKVEEMVFTPFQNTLENEFPNIIKHKHNLRKYCLDKDSASNRYHATRKETLKDDMEEADTKVEQCRDLLAIETFNLLAKENEFSEYVLQLLKLQRGYHESALKNLETIIPQLEKKIGNSSVRKVFGTPLKEHLRITGKKVAYPLEICISALSEYGMLEEGLFRITASATKVKRLKSAVDSGCFSYLIPEYRDAHVLASLLKTYLRELPEPLLMFHLHKEWIEAMHSQENQMEIVKSIIQKLPQENKDNLSYLFHFLHKCTQHSENKMSPSNLAIVFSPNLLWTENEKENVNIGNCVVINMLIELFIKNAKSLFPDDVSKYVTVTQLLPEEQTSSIYKISPDSLDVKSSSPKPNIRKKKYAPIPPHNERIATDWKSSNLERKNKNAQNAFNLSIDSLNCEQNIVIQEAEKNSKHVDLLESIDDKPKNINQPVNKTYKTVASHVICSPNDTKPEKSSPSSNAPKVLNTAGNNTSVKKNETTIRPPKPEVPARPLSLTKNSPSEIKKTHCSVYSVADKLHPSIINIEEPKHDICKPKLQEAEKYEPKKKVEIKIADDQTCDIVCNCSKEPISNISRPDIDVKKTKSTEHINQENLPFNNERLDINQKPNHVRAKSEGSAIDLNNKEQFFKNVA